MKKLEVGNDKACGYDGRVLRISLCSTRRVNKAMDNEKMLSTAVVHTHRLLDHIPNRLNNNYFLTVIKSLKSNSYSEATTQYFFCPSATPFIEASGGIYPSNCKMFILSFCLGIQRLLTLLHWQGAH